MFTCSMLYMKCNSARFDGNYSMIPFSVFSRHIFFGCTARFVSDMFAIVGDRFSRDAAYSYTGTWFFLCLG